MMEHEAKRSARQVKNLFEFVREYARLTRKTVTSLKRYESVLWLSDLPREPECDCALWQPREDYETPAHWIEVKQVTLKAPPPVPRETRAWVDEEALRNAELERPELRARILNPEWTTENADEIDQFLDLANYPAVKQAWDDYVAHQWKAWAAATRNKYKVQSVYNLLFALHRSQLTLSEQFEIVLAVGCLRWCPPASNEEVRRHLLTVPVYIEFDADRAIMTVRTADHAEGIDLELDMLNPQDRPPERYQGEIKAALAQVEADILHPHVIDVLRKFANVMQGDFEDIECQPSDACSPRPALSPSPALLVRKRTHVGLIEVCDRIVKEVDAAAHVPPLLRKIVGETGVDQEPEPFGRDGAGKRHEASDAEIYFPLAANNEQKQILKRLEQQVGVLVQGPPGTGKSQTIANLICHLLAQGRRILVASQKAPALRVLKDKLPPEIAELCILVLGENRDAMESLKGSVNEICNRRSDWNPAAQQRRIDELRAKLQDARKREAEIFESLCGIREDETRQFTNVAGRYSGSLGQIAARLKSEEKEFEWFQDGPSQLLSIVEHEAMPMPVSQEDAQTLLRFKRGITEDVMARAAGAVIDHAKMPSADQCAQWFQAEDHALRKWRKVQDRASHAHFTALNKAQPQHMEGVSKRLDCICKNLRTLYADPEPWNKHMAEDVLQGRSETYQDLLAQTERYLSSIGPKLQRVNDLHISDLADEPHRVLLGRVTELKRHLEKRGWLRIAFLRPQPVKNAIDIVKKTRVDGRPCRTLQTVALLADWLETAEACRALRTQWAFLVQVSETLPFNQQVSRFNRFMAHTRKVLWLLEHAQSVQKYLATLGVLEPIQWSDLDQVEHLRVIVHAVEIKRRLKAASEPIEQLQARIARFCERGDANAAVQTLAESVATRDPAAYRKALDAIVSVHQLKAQIARMQKLDEALRLQFPRLHASLKELFQDGVLDHRLASLRHAWDWSCARLWIEKKAKRETEEQLKRQLESQRRTISRCIGDLAAAKAWFHCLSNLTERSEQSLRSWRKAVERIGKGTGKYAERNRQVARKELVACRDSVPAWVMPLYKVVDTLKVDPGAFDVVIIDEASQCGPEALFLAYLGKQLIVVGDDQQIRPENVGINQEDVHALQQRYLADIPNHHIFSATESLFSIAELRFSNPVYLREHFRCMPEIIEFNNRLCYENQPLVPLKQFGVNRLKPVLKPQYVSAGYQEPSGINPEEARAVADAIVACCKDPAYKGKTFGVISLLSSSKQAEEIERLVAQRIDAQEIERRNIHFGDAYDFQGDERDVIFLSMVSARAGDRKVGVLGKDTDKRRFNVAVSRAKDQLWLFHSMKEEELSNACLRHRLLNYMRGGGVPEKVNRVDPLKLAEFRKQAYLCDRIKERPPGDFESWFEVDVYLDIVGRGYLVYPQYQVEGRRIDLVIVGGSGKLGVECDGDFWHGPDRHKEDLARQRDLERCGWTIWRLRESNYRLDPMAALKPLWELLEARGFRPMGADSEMPDSEETNDSDENDQAASSEESNGYGEPDCDSQECPEEVRPTPETPPRTWRAPSHAGNAGQERISSAGRATRACFNAEDVLALPTRDLGNVLCQILYECPNHSCKKDALTKKVTNYFGFRTRSGPRRDLTKKINHAVAYLVRRNVVKEYRATNLRVKLVHSEHQTTLFDEKVNSQAQVESPLGRKHGNGVE